jgi:MFS family permease
VSSLGRANEKLSRPARLVVIGYGVSTFGGGLVMPFNAIYLHTVRGLPVTLVGLVYTVIAVGGFATTPFAGRIVDRSSPARTMAVGAIVQGAGWLGLARATATPQTIPPAVGGGLGNRVY